MTAWPTTDGLALEVTEVVVAAALTVTVVVLVAVVTKLGSLPLALKVAVTV